MGKLLEVSNLLDLGSFTCFLSSDYITLQLRVQAGTGTLEPAASALGKALHSLQMLES